MWQVRWDLLSPVVLSGVLVLETRLFIVQLRESPMSLFGLLHYDSNSGAQSSCGQVTLIRSAMLQAKSR